MRFLLSGLLLASLCALSSRSVSSSGTLVVIQTPDVSVMEGETINITCCWTGGLERTRLFVNWWKNQTDIKEEIFKLEKHPQESLHKKTSDCTDLTFISITGEDSGRYTCKVTVEIPIVSVSEGNGTSITVTVRESDCTEDVSSSGTSIFNRTPDASDMEGKTDDHRDPSIGGGVSSSGTLVVTQTPDVSVMEGETVNITCCWTGGSERLRLFVNWWKNQTDIKEEIFKLEKHPQESLHKKTSDCTDLTFTNIKREDSGRYTCRVTVEVPILSVFEGSGASITVTARAKTDENIDPPIAGGSHWEELIFFLRCLPILALVISFFCLYKLETKAQQRSAAAPGNKLPSAQRLEEDQEEEEKDQRGEAE